MSTAIQILIVLLAWVLFFFLLFVVVRAAVISAIRAAGANISTTNALIGQQAELTQRLAKHLTAQSDLMLITAKNDGVSDESLAPVIKQLEERKADPSFDSKFFGLPMQ